MEQIKQSSEIPAFYCSETQNENFQANLSNLEKKQLCGILKEEKRSFKKEIKAFCHAHKNFRDEIKAFHKETKAKALWKEIKIFREKNKACTEEIKNALEDSNSLLQKIRYFQMKKERKKAGQEAVRAFLKQNEDTQEKNKSLYEKNKMLQGKYKALQRNNKAFWKDSMNFWKKDKVFWEEDLAITITKLILWEECIAPGENDWRIQKEKGALWDVMKVLRNVYIPPGEEKQLETEENNLCGNYGPDIDTRNKTLE